MPTLVFLATMTAAAATPDLTSMLQADDWEVSVPESPYEAGELYDLATNTRLKAREECFERSSEGGLYEEEPVIEAMRAASRVRLGLEELPNGGARYRLRTLAEPYLSELVPERQNLTEACIDSFAEADVSTVVVVVAVLTAEMRERDCIANQGGVEQCVERWSGHGVVATKTVPLQELLAKAAELPATSTWVPLKLVHEMIMGSDAVASCFEAAAQSGPLPQRVDVKFTIPPSGTAEDLVVVQPEHERFAVCLGFAIGSLKFPETAGTGTSLTYPFLPQKTFRPPRHSHPPAPPEGRAPR